MKTKLFLIGLVTALFPAVAPAQNLYVANDWGNTVGEYSLNGTLVRQFQGSEAAPIDKPSGLALDSRGNLYVASLNANKILKFDTNGNGSVFASASNGLSFYPGFPAGLAFDSRGNLYVANGYPSNTILEFTDNNGTLSTNPTVFAGFSWPSVLAFDSGGNLYVSSPNGWVGKFACTNGTLNTTATVFASSLNWPGGIAFDGSGNVYVGNGSTSGSVEEYSSAGSHVATFGGLPGYVGGLAFDSSGNLYAATWSNSGILEFTNSGGNLSTNAITFAGGFASMGVYFQFPPPATPTLGITLVSNLPVAVWPACATNWVLQMTTNLASGNWVTVSNGIPFCGLQLTNSPGNAFFRLLQF